MVLVFSRPSRGSPRWFRAPFAPCAAPALRSRLRVLARPRRRARRVPPPACWRVARRTRPRRPPLTWRPLRLVLARMASTTGSAIASTTSFPATPPPRPATSCCFTASAWAPSTTRRSSPPSRTRARACGRSTSSARAPRGHPPARTRRPASATPSTPGATRWSTSSSSASARRRSSPATPSAATSPPTSPPPPPICARGSS